MGIKYTNNAYSTLASGITNVATSISVQPGHGARFPSIADSNEYFYVTLANSSNTLEIVKVTARSTDTLTVVRAQEGTTGTAYSSGDRIELRVTAAGLTEFASPHVKGTAIASAGTITIPDGGSYFHVTGTTGITDIDFTTPSNGRWAWLIFDGALTITHNGTTLLLPSATSITTAANDRALFVQDAADNVICLAYVRSGGMIIDASGNISNVGNLGVNGTLTVVSGFVAGGGASGTFTSGTLGFKNAAIQLQDSAPTFTTTVDQTSTQTRIYNNAGTEIRLLSNSNSNSLGVKVGNTGILTAEGSFSRSAPVTKSADFTVAASENWLINAKAASTCTVTLPAAASFIGREIMFKNTVAFTVVSNASNVVPLAGGAAGTAMLSANAGRWCTLISDGTNWVTMSGVI